MYYRLTMLAYVRTSELLNYNLDILFCTVTSHEECGDADFFCGIKEKNKRTTITNGTLIVIQLLCTTGKMICYLLEIAACAAASLAMGTRNGEQDT